MDPERPRTRVTQTGKYVRHPPDPRLPSSVTNTPWVWAEAPDRAQRPVAEGTAGKWLLFYPLATHDAWWAKIRDATTGGTLGFRAKAATARPNANEISRERRLICVYTFDASNEGDAMRVAHALGTLGVDDVIYYKSDQATLDGRYRARGSGRVSLYSADLRRR